MAEFKPSPSLLRFEGFELDLRSGELRREGGSIVRLTEQPFRILVLLLDHPQEVVTREEIRKRLWSNDTIVEFEHSISAAMNRLRQVLGDSAESPRYVETLARRGYRWMVPVERVGGTSDALLQNVKTSASKATSKFGLLTSLIVFILFFLVALIWFRRTPPLPHVTKWNQVTNNGLIKGILVTDGPRLYFEQGALELPSLAQVSAQGGEVAPIALPFKNVELWDISPNKTELLLGTDATSALSPNGQLWVLPIAAGPPHRVANVLGHSACWAPNGQNIAYANSTDLYFANVDGTQVRKLATMTGIPWWCRFSPDGGRVRFTIQTFTAPPELWEVAVAGTGLHRLRENACCGSWSPGGKYYFFESDPDIWVTRGDNSNFDERSVARLTNGPLLAEEPVPSVDGRGVFVVGTQERGDLSRFDMRSKAVTPFLNGVSAGEVSISPDRKWAAYVSYPDLGLWRSMLDGTERLQLTFPPTQAAEPQWSPDGKQIIFTDQFRSNIFVIRSEGGSIRQLMPSDKAEIIGSGTWSPDGKSIVFVRGNLTEGAIYRLNIQSGTISKVPKSERMYSARLSPTGRYISALRFGQDSLMLYDVNLGTWSELAHGGSFDCNSWSRDGSFVYVKNRLQGQPMILERMRVADHKREQITVLKDIGRRGWISLDSDDSIIFTRDASTHEIYRLDLSFPRF